MSWRPRSARRADAAGSWCGWWRRTAEIIAGERRWRAAQLAGLTEVPTLIRDIPDENALAMALIENIQRENLNPLEEALGLQRLVDEFSPDPSAGGRCRRPFAPAASNPAAPAVTRCAGAGTC